MRLLVHGGSESVGLLERKENCSVLIQGVLSAVPTEQCGL